MVSLELFGAVGRAAYESYLAVANGRTTNGAALPAWDALPPVVRMTWVTACAGVAAKLHDGEITLIEGTF